MSDFAINSTAYSGVNAVGYNFITAISGYRRVHGRLIQALTKVQPLRPGMDILDFGCGTGFLTAAFQRAQDRLSITGIEPSPHMAAYFKHRFGADESVRIFLGGYNGHMNFNGQKFDVVASTGVMDYLEINSLLMERFLRHVKPGGHLAFSYERHRGKKPCISKEEYRSHSDDHVRQSLEQAGARVMCQDKMIGYITPHIARYGLVVACK